MITIVLCISVYIGVDKGPNKYGLQSGFGHGPPFEKACTTSSNEMGLWWGLVFKYVMRSRKTHHMVKNSHCEFLVLFEIFQSPLSRTF